MCSPPENNGCFTCTKIIDFVLYRLLKIFETKSLGEKKMFPESDLNIIQSENYDLYQITISYYNLPIRYIIFLLTHNGKQNISNTQIFLQINIVNKSQFENTNDHQEVCQII